MTSTALPEGFPGSLREHLDPDPVLLPAPGDRLAAVLAALVGPEYSLVFIRRPEFMSRHAGQISFPGGLLEDQDASLADAALRETREELGIEPAAIEVLGSLPPVHTVVSATLVVPFVGLLATPPIYRPQPNEVEEVFEVPIAQLEEVERFEEMERGGMRFMTYRYEVDGRTIWGATAQMLHHLLEIVRNPVTKT